LLLHASVKLIQAHRTDKLLHATSGQNLGHNLGHGAASSASNPTAAAARGVQESRYRSGLDISVALEIDEGTYCNFNPS